MNCVITGKDLIDNLCFWELMGSIKSLDGCADEIIENVLPFTKVEDGIALAESVLAPKPKPRVYCFVEEGPGGRCLVHHYEERFD